VEWSLIISALLKWNAQKSEHTYSELETVDVSGSNIIGLKK